ncbi:uncharacterized protein [Dermacentor albipictus]|uniref:uncharacterized protein n=1 Tax=Dermacentor albipictus TaxID=60249 RepID=UPI0038FC0481
MANALLNADADKAHQSSTGAPEDEDMEIRESQGLLPAAEENKEDNEPWINVTSRARRRRLQTRSTTPQLSPTPPKPVLRHSRPAMRKTRQPPLPADDYKLAVRPRNGLQLNKVSPGKLVDAITNAAKLQIGSTGFKVRIDEDQNILVLSTASEATASALSKMQKITIDATTYDIASYGISPDNSCKGVIHNIDHDTTPEMLLKRIESPGYEALTCRRLGNTTTMVITFLGKTVPYYIEFSGLLLRCYLYKRTVPHCRTCNETGHREDVCPRPPATPKCRECGTSLATEQHECHPRCSLCGGDHPTAAKACPNRFLPPVNRRKLQQTPRAGSSSPRPRGEHSASRKSRSPKRRGAVQGRSSSRPRSGSRRRTSSRRRTPSHGRTSSRGRSANGRRGSKGAAQVTQQIAILLLTPAGYGGKGQHVETNLTYFPRYLGSQVPTTPFYLDEHDLQHHCSATTTLDNATDFSATTGRLWATPTVKGGDRLRWATGHGSSAGTMSSNPFPFAIQKQAAAFE